MNIGTLTIEMAANVARLRTDMDEAKSVVATASKAMQESFAIARQAFVAIAGISSVAAFKGMIDGVIEAKAELQRLSIMTGTSVEALSAIGATAKLTGTNIQDVSSAINKLQKNMATSNEDSKGAASALKALHIEFDTFKAMKPDEQMLTVAKALDKFEDGGGKAAAMMLLFGKTGAALLPMMRELADKNELIGKTTAESAEQAEQFEKNMKKLDAAGQAWKRMLTDELLPTLERVTNAMVRARQESGALAAIQAGMATFLTGDDQYKNDKAMVGLTDQLLAAEKALADARNARIQSPGRILVLEGEVKRTQEALSTTLAYRKALQEEADAVKAAEDAKKQERQRNGQVDVKVPGKDRSTVDEGLSLLNSLQTRYEALIGRTSEYEQVERKLAAMKKEVAPALRAEIEATAIRIDKKVTENKLTESQVALLKAQDQAQSALSDTYGNALRDLQESGRAQEREIDLLGMTADEIERVRFARENEVKVNKLLGVLYEARANDLISEVDLRKKVKDITDAQTAALEKLGERQEAQEARRRDPQAGIADSLKQYQLNVSRLGDSFKDLSDKTIGGLEDRLSEFFAKGKTDWKGYFQGIIQEMLRLRIVRPFLNDLFKPGGIGSSGLTALGGGGSGFSGLLGGIKGLFGGGSSSFETGIELSGMYAAGGRPPAGQAAIVGENGPELWVPDAAGTVVPNGGMGGTVFAPVTHVSVDSRADRAQVIAEVQGVVQANNRAFVAELRKQGVLA